MNSAAVRDQVRSFWKRTAFTGTEAHCFAPWYLHQKFQLPESQAMQQSSDGNYDFGVDAFHFESGNGAKPDTLVLVQAKYTESLQMVAKGFKDLERTLGEIGRCLQGLEPENVVENKVLMNLRAALNRLTEESQSSLELELQVLHLSGEEEAILGQRLGGAMTRLREVVADVLDGHTCRIRPVGPVHVGPQQIVVARPETVMLRLEGAHHFSAGEGASMLTGVGRLADLVNLYCARRDALFSRNVRYYLMSKKNTEKGPAGKMRATLKQICVEGTLTPERFAMFHNGITLFARRSEVVDGGVELREAFVLNGCQTIKNAFFFRYDPHLRTKIKEDLWERVLLPIRIVQTSEDELVRTVTVNNNRQNAMSACCNTVSRSSMKSTGTITSSLQANVTASPELLNRRLPSNDSGVTRP